MSDQKHIWEAGLRPKVEQHEFEYDPTAWVEMEQLLDGGLILGTPTSTTAGNNSSLTARLRWSIVLLLGAAFLFMLVRDTTVSDAFENTSDASTEQLDNRQLESVLEIQAQLPSLLESNMERQGGATPKNQIQRVEPLAPLPSLKKEVQMLPERQGAYPTRFLPGPELVPLPDSLGRKDLLLELEPSTRKRNRRTLFPDVLESPVRKRDRKTLFPDIINQ